LAETKESATTFTNKARKMERNANRSAADCIRRTIAEISERLSKINTEADDEHVGLLASFGCFGVVRNECLLCFGVFCVCFCIFKNGLVYTVIILNKMLV